MRDSVATSWARLVLTHISSIMAAGKHLIIVLVCMQKTLFASEMIMEIIN